MQIKGFNKVSRKMCVWLEWGISRPFYLSCKLKHCAYAYQYSLMYTVQMCFSYYEFKIRLIRQIPIFELQPTDSQSGVITITLKSQLWMGDTEKLILLIKLVKYKIGKYDYAFSDIQSKIIYLPSTFQWQIKSYQSSYF